MLKYVSQKRVVDYDVAMRFSLLRAALCLAACVSISQSPVMAAPVEVIKEAPQTDETPAQHLDALFAALKRTRDPQQASAIADEIRAQWNDSGSATVNLLLDWADKAILEKRTAAAFDFLDQAIALKPDFAEAWNRRATLNFALGNYRKSMADIERVLAIEPRHFSAIAGMAAILSETGNDKLTLQAWERFLEIYPADRAAEEEAGKLAEKLAGNPT